MILGVQKYNVAKFFLQLYFRKKYLACRFNNQFRNYEPWNFQLRYSKKATKTFRDLKFSKILTNQKICDETLLKPLKIGQNIREIRISRLVSELFVGSGECEKIKEIIRETFDKKKLQKGNHPMIPYHQTIVSSTWWIWVKVFFKAIMPETDRNRLHVSIVSSNRRDLVNRLSFCQSEQSATV